MTEAAPIRATSRTMWLGVATGFILLTTAWVVFIIVARHTHVQSVPLATAGGRP
jgi:hypothetical protein